LCSGKFGALLEPRLVILRRIDHERPFHSGMAETAKLSANHFVAPGFNRREPNWNKRAWDRIPPMRIAGKK